MKVLVVVPSFPSLNQPWIDTYLESLLREGIQFVVFTAQQNPHEYQPKVDHLGLLNHSAHYSNDRSVWLRGLGRSLLISPLWTVRQWWFLARDIAACQVSLSRKLKAAMRSTYLASLVKRAGNFDVFHGHFEDSTFEFLLAARALDRPMAMTFHGLPPKGIAQPAAWRRPYLYRYLARVFVNTDYARLAVGDLGCPVSKAAIVPQGLPLPDFDFCPQPAPAPGSPLRIITIGRFHRDKGHARAILAARRLRDRGIDFCWTFVGVGPADEIMRLRRYIASLKLEQQVRLLVAAPADALQSELCKAHLFVLSSLDQGPGAHVETQGVVVQEAQASGCIPIVTRVGGVPECVRDGIDAIVVRPGSSRAISDAVLDLLSRTDDWPQMMAEGRKNVESRFSSVVIGKEMARHLRALAEAGIRTDQ